MKKKSIFLLLLFPMILVFTDSCRPKRSCCSRPSKPTSYYNKRNSEFNRKLQRSKVVSKDNMVIIYPDQKENKEVGERKKKRNFEIENNTDFVFSSEKSVKQTLNFKFGSFKFHNPQCNDVILLENLEIEDSPRFFARNSFDELWKLYIFMHDHPEISIKINGYPNEIAKYSPEETIKITAKATENVYKFLLYQNIDKERVAFESANFKIDNRKFPFLISQPFWIEIVIMSMEKKINSFD